MKIRAITLGQPLKTSSNLFAIQENLEKIQLLKESFKNKGIEVQYVRFCAPPFDNQTSMIESQNWDEVLSGLERMIAEGILDIYSFSPGLCDQTEKLSDTQVNLLQNLPNLINKYPNMFSSVQVASSTNGFNFEAIDQCTTIIQKLSRPDPFQNLKFAITFNVRGNTPFFPSAYHLGKHAKISIALEAADEIVSILTDKNCINENFENIRQAIQRKFEAIYDSIIAIVGPFCKQHEIIFEGIDFSPAPYPTREKSIGYALEKLGLSHFGESGSVFAVGFLTHAIQSVNRPKIGFSGFMQPLLEDFVIAERNNEGKVDITKLLLFSTMCGLGLDCIPIPGDSDPTTIKLLLMDLAMLSLRLKKPLTARLMPIPNKKAGTHTSFNFEFFTNSQVCRLDKTHNESFSKFLTQNPYFLF